MAELGQTSDPKVLIPGEPDAVDDTISKLRQQSEKFGTTGDNLKCIDVVGWTGEASHAFMDLFSKEPSKWFKVSDLLDSALKSLTEYASTLRWAQGQAAEAIARWEEGESATARAKTAYKAIADRANAQNRAHAATGGSDFVSLEPFSDPGERVRRDAVELLKRAREQLNDVGRRVAEQIARQQSRERSLLDELVDLATRDQESTGKVNLSGPGAGLEAKSPADGKLGELKAFAQLGKATVEGSAGNEFLKRSGKAELVAEAASTVAASITDEGVKGRAEASAGGKATLEGRVDAGPLGANAKGEVFVGAQAGAQATAGRDGLHASADAFAGAKETGKVGADVGGIGVNLTGEAWAGAGAEAGATVGKDDDGTWHVGANAGASLPLGGKVGFELTVDPSKVSKTFDEAAETVEKVGAGAGAAQRTISGWLD